MLDGTRFIHLRWQQEDGSTDPNSGITVGYLRQDDRILVAYSQCNPADNYNKKIGRAICTGRLIHGNCYALPIPADDQKLVDVVSSFVNKKLGYAEPSPSQPEADTA